jgi:hypothetical protein
MADLRVPVRGRDVSLETHLLPRSRTFGEPIRVPNGAQFRGPVYVDLDATFPHRGAPLRLARGPASWRAGAPGRPRRRQATLFQKGAGGGKRTRYPAQSHNAPKMYTL